MDPPVPLGAFQQEDLFYTPGTAEPSECSPAELVVYENELEDGDIPKFGRFGWRAQTRSLAEFVVSACTAEIGLETSIQSQTADPRNPDYVAPGVDMSDAQVRAFVSFVRELPRPEQILPKNTTRLARVEHGSKVFSEVGCTDCHRQNLAKIGGIYSDLLLHDVGHSLRDPQPAFPPRESRRTTREFREEVFGSSFPSRRARKKPSQSSGYSEPFVPIETPREATTGREHSEWRTPPLWGVADSAPYMHDGRAETLVEAIMIHGGEASDSVRAFASLKTQDQLKMIEFLNTLRAPVQ